MVEEGDLEVVDGVVVKKGQLFCVFEYQPPPADIYPRSSESVTRSNADYRGCWRYTSLVIATYNEAIYEMTRIG